MYIISTVYYIHRYRCTLSYVEQHVSYKYWYTKLFVFALLKINKNKTTNPRRKPRVLACAAWRLNKSFPTKRGDVRL